jgi:hypothetical protein
MAQITKSKITYTLIIVLIAIIFLQRSCNNVDSGDLVKETVKIDTVWKETKDTVFKTVNIIDTKYIPVKETKYLTSNDIDTCKSRFENLLKEHLVRTVYSDTLKLDSLGTIIVKDTVWLNKLYGKREYIKDYKIPFVTKTITKQEPPKRQLYIGGNLFGNTNSMQSITPGLLYKNKKDQIYQVNIGISTNGGIIYGIGGYWKIKIK